MRWQRRQAPEAQQGHQVGAVMVTTHDHGPYGGLGSAVKGAWHVHGKAPQNAKVMKCACSVACGPVVLFSYGGLLPTPHYGSLPFGMLPVVVVGGQRKCSRACVCSLRGRSRTAGGEILYGVGSCDGWAWLLYVVGPRQTVSCPLVRNGHASP